MDQVPAIDLAPFLSGRESAAVVRDFRAACEQIGFVVVCGHGLPEQLLDRAFAQSRAFFDLPPAIKAPGRPPASPDSSVAITASPRATSAARSAPTCRPTCARAFSLARSTTTARTMLSFRRRRPAMPPTSCPTQPPGFSATMIELYRGFERLSRDLLRVFALALELPETWFADKISRHFSIMSSHHYPPLQEQPPPRTIAHRRAH